MINTSLLIESGKTSGLLDRTGDIISWVSDNKANLDLMSGDQVVQALLAELSRLNAQDGERIAKAKEVIANN